MNLRWITQSTQPQPRASRPVRFRFYLNHSILSLNSSQYQFRFHPKFLLLNFPLVSNFSISSQCTLVYSHLLHHSHVLSSSQKIFALTNQQVSSALAMIHSNSLTVHSTATNAYKLSHITLAVFKRAYLYLFRSLKLAFNFIMSTRSSHIDFLFALFTKKKKKKKKKNQVYPNRYQAHQLARRSSI